MQKKTTLGISTVAALAFMVSTANAADLVVYDAVDFAGTTIKAFTAKTGITVDVVEPGSTGETLGKVAAEGDNPQFDLIWLDGSAVMVRMMQDHILQAVPDDAIAGVKFNDMGKALLPKNHAFLPTGASTTAIEVNTKKVPADQMPKTWADLEKFAGKVAAKDPNLSGPAYQWIAGFFQVEGVDAGKALMKKMLTNKAISGLPNGGKVNKAILTGDASVGINQDSGILGKIKAGEPLAVVYPKDGLVALPAGLGISAKTKHMDMVKKFIAFVTSAEGQAAMQDGDDTDFYFLPVIEGVKPKVERPKDIKFIVLDDAKAAASEKEWKQWYKDSFVP